METRDEDFTPVLSFFANFVSDLLVIINIMCNFTARKVKNMFKRKVNKIAKSAAPAGGGAMTSGFPCRQGAGSLMRYVYQQIKLT